MKILVAADGSPYTKRMLAYLAAHDESFGSKQNQFTVLTVVGPIPARAASALSKPIVHEYYADEAEATFKPIRAFFSKQGVEAQFEHRVGNAGDQIAAVARKGKFDLVVIAGDHLDISSIASVDALDSSAAVTVSVDADTATTVASCADTGEAGECWRSAARPDTSLQR